jgi:hypothetical protein
MAELTIPTGIESIMRVPTASETPVASNNSIDAKYLENSWNPPVQNSANIGLSQSEIPQIPEVNLTPSLGPPSSTTGFNQFNVVGNISSATQNELNFVKENNQTAKTAMDLPSAVADLREKQGFNPKVEKAFIDTWETNQKITALCSINEYKKRGCMVQTLTMNHDLKTVNVELQRIRRAIDIEASVSSYRSMLLGMVVLIEIGNNWSRKKLNFDGWSKSFKQNDLPKCELLIFQIVEQTKVLAGPKLLLLQVICGSAFFFHFSKGMGEELGKVVGKPMSEAIMSKFRKDPTQFINFFAGGKNNKAKGYSDDILPPLPRDTPIPAASVNTPPLPEKEIMNVEAVSVISDSTMNNITGKRRGRPKKKNNIQVEI